jgi:hypothetical protein
MRAPRKPFQPAPKVAPKPRLEGATSLVLALILAGAVIAVGALRGPRSLDPARAPLAKSVTVNLTPQDRARLDDWSEFFACHGLVNSDLVMLATLRANDGQWRPERPIRLELAPSADQPPATPAELAVLDKVTALANGPAAERDRACASAASAEPAAPATPAPETRP